ncbi:hypothetical protein [Streptomyces xinghaiensis]|uniref:hypothetical protein n=1 Tax=Streptomyces xinghaiensis TaxID=1038928 RepID=UPI0002FCEE9C|nr:hypothetical protein [Streptomyces xinghaiensis]MZE76562.1 hypothetical protein [Streptomyces sp. SID5475]
MEKVPPGHHRVRSYVRRNPRPRAKGMSGWTIAGIFGLIVLWGQVFGFGEEEIPQPTAPKPSVSAPAVP